MIQRRPKYAEGHDVNSHSTAKVSIGAGNHPKRRESAGFGPQKLGLTAYLQYLDKVDLWG